MRVCVREVVGVTESPYHPPIDRHRACLPVEDATLIKLSHGIISEIGISKETGKERETKAFLACHMEEAYICKSLTPP